MNNRTLQRIVILTCCILICLITSYAISVENSHGQNDKYLSVRDSLIPMFGKAFSSEAYNDKEFPFNRLNPQTREYIRFYIEEDNIDREIGSAGIWLLGFIGDKEEILFVEKYVDKNVKESINPDNSLNISNGLAANVGCFAGMMLTRNIEGAESFLKKYANVSSWIIPGKENNLEYLYTARKFYSYFIMSAYQYSKLPYLATLLQEKSSDSKPYFHESFVDSYLKIKVDKYTELMKPVSISEKKMNENMAKCIEQYGGWIERLLKKQTYVGWRKEEEQKVISPSQAKPVSDFEIVDFSKTVEGDNIKAIVLDAVKAYQKSKIDKDMKSILIENEILQDVQKAGIKNFTDFKVKAEIEAKIDNFVPAMTSKPKVVFDKVHANISFDILGSADLLKRFDVVAAHASIVSPKTGDLIAVMIRTNSGWLWAPFTNSPLVTDSNIVSDEYLIDIVNKGIMAYHEISQSIINGNYDLKTIPILDNGKLLPLNKRERLKDEFLKGLDFEKKILEDLDNDNLNNYGDYQIIITYDATLENGTFNIDSGVLPEDIKGYETADLTFKIRNGAEAYKKNTTSRIDQSDTDGAGDLQVTMKRINGKWYWNPFGW